MHRLILIRHAQSEHQLRDLTGGWTDTSLSEHGIMQASLVANYCRQRWVDAPALCLFSSDLARAAQTAAYVADALSIPCRLEPALREINNGLAAGLTQEAAVRLEQPLTERSSTGGPTPRRRAGA